MMLTEKLPLKLTFIAILFSFHKSSKSLLSGTLKVSETYDHERSMKKPKSKISLLKVFLDYWRQEGKGRVGQGFDVYLLDNRNRTQKWDE